MKKNLILLGATLVISLLFAEGVLHLFPTSMRHWFPENMYQNDADPKIGYRLSENINAFVSTPHFERWVAEGKGVDLLAAQRWIPDFLKSYPEVDYVDFGPIFKQHYQRGGESLYIPFDQHNNELGNDFIASHLSNILK